MKIYIDQEDDLDEIYAMCNSSKQNKQHQGYMNTGIEYKLF